MCTMFSHRTTVRNPNISTGSVEALGEVSGRVMDTRLSRGLAMTGTTTTYTTRFGSLDDFTKGGIEIIDDNPKNYAFSNVFEVAASAGPWEKVAVAKNMQYVLEVIRAEGESEWRTCAHDEFPLVLDGEVEIELIRPDEALVPADKEGSIRLDAEPAGRRMGRVVLRRGHQGLLPAGAAYRFTATRPSVILLQTIQGDDTVERWAEICLS
jgi:hypothetical protein